MNWYVQVLEKYAVFTGRVMRKEYWYFTLINFIISIIIPMTDSELVLCDTMANICLLPSIDMIAIFMPVMAVTVCRLHDIGKSDWWILINLIPIIGTIVSLFLW